MTVRENNYQRRTHATPSAAPAEAAGLLTVKQRGTKSAVIKVLTFVKNLTSRNRTKAVSLLAVFRRKPSGTVPTRTKRCAPIVGQIGTASTVYRAIRAPSLGTFAVATSALKVAFSSLGPCLIKAPKFTPTTKKPTRDRCA